MPKHEFAIMDIPPSATERFDEYEPYKYNNCIAIHDDYIEPLLTELLEVDFYWHTLQMPGKGIAYFGITLIPPTSHNYFADILLRYNKNDYEPLISLLRQAKDSGKYIIHFGI